MWRAVHLVALGHDRRKPKDAAAGAEAYRRYFEALADVLPCDVCATGFRLRLSEADALPSLMRAIGERRLFEWTVELHNAVSRELGKVDAWTPERALEAALEAALEKTAEDDPGGRPSSFAATVTALGAALAVGFVSAALFALVAWAAVLAAWTRLVVPVSSFFRSRG